MSRESSVMSMPKLPKDPDDFKYFKRDPPEVKLEAWRRLQHRLVIRDLSRLVLGVIIACLIRS